jgi:signal transduction histidine kinase
MFIVYRETYLDAEVRHLLILGRTSIRGRRFSLRPLFSATASIRTNGVEVGVTREKRKPYNYQCQHLPEDAGRRSSNVDGAPETARRTIRDGTRASDVITRLRALFGKKSATTELVDLNDATREVIALSLSELQRNRVMLRAELANDLPPVRGDRVQLQQVILNLLLNASEAMSGVDNRSRQLVIRTDRYEGDCVRLSVQDTDVGFDTHAADRLFEAFYTTKTGGMGIGLSVSRSIIESHHGHLWASPNEGPGATFSFSIPGASESVAEASSPRAIPMPASTGTNRVARNS